MKKKALIQLFLFTAFVAWCGPLYAGWIEKKEPVMKGVGWNYPAVYKDKLVFDTGGGDGAGKQLGTYSYDIVTGKLKFLTTKGIRAVKAIYGNNIVFTEGREIFLYDLGKNKMTDIGKGGSVPSIYSDWVVYEDDGDLVLYDIKKKKEKRVPLSGKMVASREVGPGIYGDTVVWIEKGDDGGLVLSSYSISQGRLRKHANFPPEEVYDIKVFKFQNDIVLLSDYKDAYIYNMSKGTPKRLTKPDSKIFLSSINMGRIAWDHSGLETFSLYDIAKDEYTELVSEGSEVYSVAGLEDKIFFVDLKKYEIRMLQFKAD